VGDLFLLVVAVEVPWWLGERLVGAATEDDAPFFVGHGGDELADVFAEWLSRHASADGHHHVHDEVRVVVDDGVGVDLEVGLPAAGLRPAACRRRVTASSPRSEPSALARASCCGH
jgi:hypothetical protein